MKREKNVRLAVLGSSLSMAENRLNCWSGMSGGAIENGSFEQKASLFRKRTRKKLNEFWTGGNDVEVEGKWEWSGGRGPGELSQANPDPDLMLTVLRLMVFVLKLETLVGESLSQSIQENCLVWVVELHRGTR